MRRTPRPAAYSDFASFSRFVPSSLTRDSGCSRACSSGAGWPLPIEEVVGLESHCIGAPLVMDGAGQDDDRLPRTRFCVTLLLAIA